MSGNTGNVKTVTLKGDLVVIMHLQIEVVDGLANIAPSPSSSSELNSQLNISQAVCHIRRYKQ